MINPDDAASERARPFLLVSIKQARVWAGLSRQSVFFNESYLFRIDDFNFFIFVVTNFAYFYLLASF